MSVARSIRFGHAIKADDGEALAELLRRVLDIVVGVRLLEAREPAERTIVFEAERVLGYESGRRPIYVYVGDIHPDLGVVGLVVRRDLSVQSVTRCDSGGMFGGKGNFDAVVTEERQAAMLLLSLLEGQGADLWEEEFDDEVREVHLSAEAYVRGDCPEPSRFPHGDPRRDCVRRGLAGSARPIDRRAWTWEARTISPPRSEQILAVVLSNTANEMYQQLVAREDTVLLPQQPVIPAEDRAAGPPGGWCRPENLNPWLLEEDAR